MKLTERFRVFQHEFRDYVKATDKNFNYIGIVAGVCTGILLLPIIFLGAELSEIRELLEAILVALSSVGG